MPPVEPATRQPEDPPRAASAAGGAPAADRGSRRGRLVRALFVVAVLVAMVMVLVVGGRSRFEGYMTSHKTEHEHAVFLGDPIFLSFVDREHSNTHYLVKYVNGRTTQRFNSRTGSKGKMSTFRVGHPGHRVGKVFVRWLVEGKLRARWVFLVRDPHDSGRAAPGAELDDRWTATIRKIARR